MAAAQAGNRAAYERLLADSVMLIREVAQGHGVPPDSLDDVVQETLLAVHRMRHTYDPSRSYDAWLAAIAGRRAIDMRRRQFRRRGIHDEAAFDRQPVQGEAAEATIRAGHNAGASKINLHRALKTLHARLRGKFQGRASRAA